MTQSTSQAAQGHRKLLLACGNPLRGDDGVGWKIAEALEKDPAYAGVKIIVTQQFTPELAEDLRDADTVVFVDASATTASGEVTLVELSPAQAMPRMLTHHMPPDALLKLTQELYGRLPQRAFAVVVGGECFELGEKLTEAVQAAIPKAVAALQNIFTANL
jgi:hydrogenase maturation protease